MSPTSPALRGHLSSPVMPKWPESEIYPTWPLEFHLLFSANFKFKVFLKLSDNASRSHISVLVACCLRLISFRTAAASSYYASSRAAVHIEGMGIAPPAWSWAALRCLAVGSALFPSLDTGSFLNSPGHREQWAVMPITEQSSKQRQPPSSQ